MEVARWDSEPENVLPRGWSLETGAFPESCMLTQVAGVTEAGRNVTKV